MATSSIGRSLRRLGLSAVYTHSSTVASLRSFSASTRRCEDDSRKPPSQSSNEASASSSSSTSSSDASSSKETKDATTTSYQPPSKATGSWPFDSNSSDSAASASSSNSNPYAGLFDGSDPFPKVSVPKLGPASSSTEPTSEKGNWLSDQLDSLSSSSSSSSSSSTRTSTRRYETPDGRRKHPIPRSVLFADSEPTRQFEDFRLRKSSPSSRSSNSYTRKRFDRTPLTQQEANAFMSLLNQALAGTSLSSPTSSNTSAFAGEAGEEGTPFGSYTSLISNPKTQSGSKALLQAFTKRNRLQRFEEARAQRAKRFVREGLAAQVDPLELEAGIDEARERIAMCENLADLFEWAKKDLWGLTTADGESTIVEGEKVKYGKDTPFYASVLQLLFLAVRDRYRSPHVALSIPRITRSLGIESYVLGVTGSLYNEVLKTQWDWLGDLQGVVTTLRQARETGILSAPQKYSSIAPGLGEEKKWMGFATSEDETIRETVDRIANEVRKYVIDTSADRRDEDVLTARKEEREGGRASVNWSQKWLLANAEEASTLAGQPFRLIQKQMRERERAEKGGRFGRFVQVKEGFGKERYDGGSAGGERRSTRPFNRDGHQGRDGRVGSRYPSSGSFGSKTPRNRVSDEL